MHLLIDNQDGLGIVDYTACLQLASDSVIIRKLNEPTLCTLSLLLQGSRLSTPVLQARVTLLGGNSISLFTGYVVSVPVCRACGESSTGPTLSVLVSAISDEVMLDVQVSSVQTTLLGETASENWASLGALSASSGVSLALAAGLNASSRVEVAAGGTWSQAARSLSNQTRSVYAAVSGIVTVGSIGQVVHAISSSDPGMSLQPIETSDVRWLARDVTVYGREEPTAYVTEVFVGDGTTANFTLSDKYFEPTSKQKTIIADDFQGTIINSALWVVSDTSALLSLTAGGLTCSGGNGRDAQVTVASIQQIEMGGVVTLEADGLEISPGSTGELVGLYTGIVNQANCFAAFSISSNSTGVAITPQINGSAVGSTLAIEAGHLYTVRLRLFAPEVERVRQSYYCLDSSGTAAVGGNTVASGGVLEFEVQDVTSGTPGAPTILFADAVSVIPPVSVVGVLDSGNLSCSIKSFSCTQTAPIWVSVGSVAASAQPQFLASAVDGGTCKMSSGGTLAFYPADVPAAGTMVFVSYRLTARSLARRSLSPSEASFSPLSERWIGTVVAPIPWSSVDCDNAAAALLTFSSNPSAAVRGTYIDVSLSSGQDIWPGDSLNIGPDIDGSYASAVVREVRLQLLPGSLRRMVQFANDWAENISIHLSSTVPDDVTVPSQPIPLSTALQSLTNLSLSAVTGDQLAFNTGMDAPVNGGFEVRRRDNTFGPGTDSDLVLRSATSNISIPRLEAVERYYVRMYDGSNPPNYSQHSAAVFLNVPL